MIERCGAIPRTCLRTMIEVQPLPNDVESDEWLEDSHRIHEENRREMMHEIHADGMVFRNGGVEGYMKLFDYHDELEY